MSGHLPNCILGLGLRQMLADFNASDQVVVLANRIISRSDPAVWLDVRPDFADSVFRNIEAISFHAAVPKAFHEKAFGATDIQYSPRFELADDLVGYSPEELQPMRILAGISTLTEATIGIIVVESGLRRCGGTRWVPGKLAPPNEPLRHRICEAPLIQRNDQQ